MAVASDAACGTQSRGIQGVLMIVFLHQFMETQCGRKTFLIEKGWISPSLVLKSRLWEHKRWLPWDWGFYF